MASFSSRHSSSEQNRCFQVLGLSPGASEEEIQQAYRRLALTHHPDKNNNDPEATRKFQEINNAYRILANSETRDASEDGEDHFPFGMHPFFFATDDDDDDDESFLFFGHPLFAMFAQEMMFQRMFREIHMRRFMSSRYHEEQETERNRRQQRWRNRSDRDLPPWARSGRFRADDDEATQHTRHFQSNSSSSHESWHRHSEEGGGWQHNCDHSGRQDEVRQNNSSGKKGKQYGKAAKEQKAREGEQKRRQREEQKRLQREEQNRRQRQRRQRESEQKRRHREEEKKRRQLEAEQRRRQREQEQSEQKCRHHQQEMEDVGSKLGHMQL
ncbi:uncharacterized protein [Amphiura filiformis]|uniref:uncharacterized protein n=1 Tax=Amphiura filiformis TaxID=82378 RepID=UPI003B216371